MKRLAVFLDGTWNDPGDNTNVWRLSSMLGTQDSQQNPQLAYYDTGVGTKWYDRFRGGITGAGLEASLHLLGGEEVTTSLGKTLLTGC